MTEHQRRMLDFDELEAWLRELPWWREWTQDIGGAVTGSGDVTGVHRAGGKPGSPTEREALDLIRIRGKVDLLNAWVGYMEGDDDTVTYKGKPPKLPPELARLIHYRYMAKTAVMGLPVEACCQVLHIARRTFYKQRQQALGLLMTAIYASNTDMGRPYADCRDELVPPMARAGGMKAEIGRCEEQAQTCDRRAHLDPEQAEYWLEKAKNWRQRAENIKKELDEE